MASPTGSYSVDSSSDVNVDDFLQSQGITLDESPSSRSTPSKMDLNSPSSPTRTSPSKKPAGGGGGTPAQSPSRRLPSSPSRTSTPAAAAAASADVSLTDTTATQDELGGVMDGLDSSADASSSDLAVGGGGAGAAGFDDDYFGGGVVADEYGNDVCVDVDADDDDDDDVRIRDIVGGLDTRSAASASKKAVRSPFHSRFESSSSSSSASSPSVSSLGFHLDGPSVSSSNKALRSHGYVPVLTSSDVPSRFVSILHDLRLRSSTIVALSQDNDLSQSLDRTSERLSDRQSADRQRESDAASRRGVALASENESLRREIAALKNRGATEIRKLKKTVEDKERLASLAEHRAVAKERVIERLTLRLRSESDSVQQKAERSKDVFRALSGGRAARSASTSDASALDVIGVYESQREKATDEIESLRREVRSLNDALRDKENDVMKKELGGAFVKTGDSIERMAERYREQEQENRALQLKEASFGRKLEKLEDKLKEAKDELSVLSDEKANLLLELKARPTVKEYKASERRIDELERKLYAAVEAAQESADVRELRKHMGTKSLIEQDKGNHRLRLDRIDAIPREISKEILKQTCRELEISDVTLIAPCISKMSKAMLLLPRLERFVNDVCGFVFGHQPSSSSSSSSSSAANNRKPMEDVLPVLKRWEQQLGAVGKNAEFKAIVMGELCRRSVVPSDVRRKENRASIESRVPGMTAEMSDEQALRAIRDLVELEKAIMAREDLYQNAESVVQQNPDLFVNRVVLHFRYLFGVKHMDGVFPKMNEIYLFANEMNAFVRELRAILAVDRNVPTASVVKSVLEMASELQARRNLRNPDFQPSAAAAADEDDQYENYVVM